MSFSEIKNLRKEGKLPEALALAEHNYTTDNYDIWNVRALAWVYYDYLKQAADQKNKEQFISILQNISDLNMSSDEKMYFDNIIWPLNKMFRILGSDQVKDIQTLLTIFNRIKLMPFEKPSSSYSILLSGLHKAFKDSRYYREVIDWWGLDNMIPEDYQSTEYEGRSIMAQAEQVYISYSKSLLQTDNGDAHSEGGIRRMKEFLPRLDLIIDSNPSYVYPSFFKAKLLLKLGSDNIMDTFIPFAKQKKNDFWVWQLMAEIHQNDPDIVFSCYCKALSLRTPDEFLVRIRQLLADILIQRQQFAEAKTEIERIVRSKKRTETKLPNQIIAWQATSWYTNSKSKRDNNELYSQYQDKAATLLFQNDPEVLVAVSYVNTEKKVLNFIVDQKKHGFFKYDGLISEPQIGDLYQVRFQGVAKDTSYRISTARKDLQTSSPALKIVEGDIRIISTGSGFIQDVYIEKSIVQKFDLHANTKHSVKAILSHNKQKNEWGWRGIEIIN